MSVKVDGTNGLLQNYDYQAPTTGFSYTFTSANVLVMNPAGTLATGTITMPASPVDGMTVSFSSTKAITALTVNANTGQTINGAPTTLIANGSASFIYRLSSTSWFPVAGENSTYIGGRGQVFTTTGANTFTVPAGVTAVKVTVCGGGGNGGALVGCTAGGGGGGAGVAIKYITGLTPGAAITVTVGAAAGTTSFGAYCSATGGGNGGNGNNIPGAGGSGSGGDLNYSARSATTGITGGVAGGTVSNQSIGMLGGCAGTTSGAAQNATGYGNGGTGNNGNGGTFLGSTGVCIVEW